MIGPTGAVRVMIATRPVDFRKGAEGLAALVRETMKSDPFSGAVYVFRAKRADRVKLIFWDGTGVCLFAKRLEDGVFRWSNVQDCVMHLTAAQLSAGAVSTSRARRRCRRRPVDLRHSESPSSDRSRRIEARDLIASMTALADALPEDPGTLKAMLLAERARAPNGWNKSSGSCAAIALAGAPRRCRKINFCSGSRRSSRLLRATRRQVKPSLRPSEHVIPSGTA